MYGIIDIGSNTIRLNIYRVEKDQPVLLLSKKNATGLASYIIHGRMTPDGIARAAQVLNGFKSLLDEFNIEGFAFATAALRNIDNSAEAIQELTRQTGLSIVLLPGEKEAELDFLGVTHSIPLAGGLLVDIGGASTELVVYQGKKLLKTFSMPIGSLNMYNKHVHHLIPTRSERKAIKQEVLDALAADNDFAKKIYTNISGICGVDGTLRAASRLNNELFDLAPDNLEINAANIKKIIKLLENDEEDELLSIDTLEILLKVVPDRVRTVLPGLIILHTLIKYFSIKTIQISCTGVREGYLYDHVLKKEDTAPSAPAEPASIKDPALSGSAAKEVSSHAENA